jgi:hypothetical protein
MVLGDALVRNSSGTDAGSQIRQEVVFRIGDTDHRPAVFRAVMAYQGHGSLAVDDPGDICGLCIRQCANDVLHAGK